ncbi:MAG TPA: Gfo/Idh/MocA family oxidoreductase, partial [Flavobacteriales bacterium]|nr:Gfo/Idh/MocA family oxidoreductase [Flavobacteriales bacterium]
MNSIDDVIKFAVVGCGHIGKRHAIMLDRNPEAELVGLVDIAHKVELGLDSFKAPLFKDMDALFDSDLEIDVVNICTANGLHAQHSIKALENDKHVVVEKPLGLNTSNCKEVISKAAAVSKHVFCVMQNRYSPPALWIKDLVERGAIG